MLLATLFAPSAGAACALTPDEVTAAAARSEQAVAADDPGTHRRVYRDVVARLPCLDGRLPASAWARLSLDEAIVRFADHQDHREPLSTALRADPGLAVPPFLVDAGLPGPSVHPTPGALRYPTTVDGARVDGPVLVDGVHVVQVFDPSGTATFVIEGGGLPAGALAAPPTTPSPAPGSRTGGGGPWGAITAGVGYGESAQTDLGPVRGPRGTVDAWGRVGLSPALGLIATGAGSFGDPVLADARLAAGFGSARAGVLAGGGLATVWVEDAAGRTLRALPVPAVGAWARAPGDRDLDVWVVGGWSPGAWDARLRAGVAVVPLSDGVSFRAGIGAAAVGARFAGGGREARVTRFEGGLALGVSARE